MSQPAQYAKVDISVNGTKILEDTTVKLTRDAGKISVYSLGANGYRGFKQGPKKLTIEFESNVPIDDFEYDSGPDQENANVVKITLACAGKTLTSLGTIMGDDLSDATNSEVKLNNKFEGDWAGWI